jgi:hypothetical protein
MKLQKKHLAPYLDCELECIVELTGSSELPWYFSEDGKYKLNGLMFDWMDSDEVTSIKPILKPLSDLDKEVLVIFNFITYPKRGDSINVYSYEFMIYCFKNHFDVFGLIEKGLAIDINTI